MHYNKKFEKDLEILRQELPDPFQIPEKLDDFFNSPAAQQLIARGTDFVRDALFFLEECKEPSLARVAVILLSRFDPSEFYLDLLSKLKNANRQMVEAFEQGLWLIKLPERQIARDIVNIVVLSGNANPLLLLQRPAAKEVRSELADFIKQRKMPLSLYSLYCFGYALERDDIPLMSAVSMWLELPELSSLAGIYLLRLGSKEGHAGIRAGLTASNVQLRTLTFYELFPYLPDEIRDRANYDPAKSVESQRSAVEILDSFLSQS